MTAATSGAGAGEEQDGRGSRDEMRRVELTEAWRVAGNPSLCDRPELQSTRCQRWQRVIGWCRIAQLQRSSGRGLHTRIYEPYMCKRSSARAAV